MYHTVYTNTEGEYTAIHVGPELVAIVYVTWAHIANHLVVAVLQCCVLSGKIECHLV